jgi:AraC-like DNA-binding protein/ligand-binding sensor protein
MNANATLIDNLANSEIYQQYESAYSEATGMPISLRPLETWKLPLHGKRKERAFCAIMAEKSRTCAACLQMQEKLAQSALNQPCTMNCAYGLCEVAVPVKLGERTIGFLQSGQVMRQKPTAASFDRVVKQGQELGVDLDNASTKEAYLQTPVASQKKIDSVSNLLAIFADHLSMKSNQLALQQANSEPPMITRAKQFILEHQEEELSLGQVAQAVHTSVFYFCKLFKKATGMNFTEFVSRTRIERAKNLLLNPNLRVSEIAFEVGFQSLTHFNRIFKKLVGQSPTEYREKLPATAAVTN